MNYLHELQNIYPPGEARAIYRMLMEVRFGLSHTALLLGKDKELSREEQAEAEKLVLRLLRHEPIQYVLGQADFCGRTFRVAPGVLIPRPETEELVKEIKPHPQPLSEERGVAACLPPRVSPLPGEGLGVRLGLRLLDVGTGSGCIAITLALAGYRVTAFDISEQALRIARENAERLGAEVDFVQEDILHPAHKCGPFDIIVSNPPYICRSEATQMDENVLRYEPHLALFVPDDDPLRFYRAIVAYAEEHLVSGRGQMLFEVNRAYGRAVQELMRQAGYADVQLCQDQYGNDRIVKGRKT